MATSMARRVVIGTKVLTNCARTASAIAKNQQCYAKIYNFDCYGVRSLNHVKSLHTTRHLCGLEEFFDDPETFEEEKVPCGRPWLKDELRLKSNTDLHKLWYVLLKERNRLLSMDALYKDESLNMPSPERIDKVEESMENLAAVVNERNRAYELLETGKTSEPKPVWRKTVLNTWRLTDETEHYEPKHQNKEYMQSVRQDPQWMVKYKKLLREKEMRKERLREKARKKELKEMQEAFPHLKIAAEE